MKKPPTRFGWWLWKLGDSKSAYMPAPMGMEIIMLIMLEKERDGAMPAASAKVVLARGCMARV
jgi:hypothetical protein